MTVKHKVKTNY